MHQNLGNYKIHSAISQRNPDWTLCLSDTVLITHTDSLNLTRVIISFQIHSTELKQEEMSSSFNLKMVLYTYRYTEVYRGYCIMIILHTGTVCAFRVHNNEMAQQIKVLPEVRQNLWGIFLSPLIRSLCDSNIIITNLQRQGGEGWGIGGVHFTLCACLTALYCSVTYSYFYFKMKMGNPAIPKCLR